MESGCRQEQGFIGGAVLKGLYFAVTFSSQPQGK